MKHVKTWMTLAICLALGCGGAGSGDDDDDSAPSGTGATSGSSGGSSGSNAGGTGAKSGGDAGSTSSGGGGKGGATSGSGGQMMMTDGSGGMTGASGSGGTTSVPIDLAPSKRNPKYSSLTPPMGEALPPGTAGMWSYLDVDGALSRDGSPAGFYYKMSATGSKNLLIYLPGGGVCADNFFCNMNPPNKTAALTAENVGTGIFNIFGPDQEAQDPNGERWQSGIFKNDPANPAADWNMVFIPYVTGDVFFGSKPDGTIPDVEGTFQFVGKSNMMKFLGRIVPTFSDAKVVLLAGSSAGGIGSLLNYTYFADSFIDQGNGARVFVLDDAGPFFDDADLEVCMQKRYRDIYGLNDSFPADCTDCVSESGGGLVKAVLGYLADKYPDGVVGGFVDSSQDEIMKFFFSEGLEECSYIDNPIVGLLAYPEERYPAALKHILTDLIDPSRLSIYVWEGDLHQNLFQTATDDRFYQKNGLDKTVAEFVSTLLTGQSERIGVIQ